MNMIETLVLELHNKEGLKELQARKVIIDALEVGLTIEIAIHIYRTYGLNSLKNKIEQWRNK